MASTSFFLFELLHANYLNEIVWGSFVNFLSFQMHADDFRNNRHGVVSDLRDGGYSDDMTLAAIAGIVSVISLRNLVQVSCFVKYIFLDIATSCITTAALHCPTYPQPNRLNFALNYRCLYFKHSVIILRQFPFFIQIA